MSSAAPYGLRRYLTASLTAVVAALAIRTAVVEIYQLPSGSMEDVLLAGDYLLANKFIYGAPLVLMGTNIRLGRLPSWRDPRPGDVVVFRSADQQGRFLVQRCVAAGGQKVEIIDKKLYVDGTLFNDPSQVKYIDHEVLADQVSTRDNFGPYVVPLDHFFMMGDNRDSSVDSRVFRGVQRDRIQALALIVWWSLRPVDPGYDTEERSMAGRVVDFFWNLPLRLRYSRLGTVVG